MWPCGPVSMPHSLPNIQRGTHTFATGHVTTSITLCANRQDPRVRCLRKKGPPGSRSSSLAPSPQCQCWQVGGRPGAIRLRKKVPFCTEAGRSMATLKLGGQGGPPRKKRMCARRDFFFADTGMPLAVPPPGVLARSLIMLAARCAWIKLHRPVGFG